MSGYKVDRKQDTSQGIQIFIAGTGAVVLQLLQSCQGCRSKSKKCDKQLTHIVRVIVRCYCQVLFFLGFTFPSPIRVPRVRTGNGTYPSMSGKSYINGTDKLK